MLLLSHGDNHYYNDPEPSNVRLALFSTMWMTMRSFDSSIFIQRQILNLCEGFTLLILTSSP